MMRPSQRQAAAEPNLALPVFVIAIGVLLFVIASVPGFAQRGGPGWSQEAPCQTLTPAATGGPMPKNPAVVVLRWLGASNHELAFRDNVFLLDAYYDRTPPARPLGFTRTDIKRANAIFIGHGHSDHMADAPYVAERTGARVFGGPPTIEAARALGLPEKQAAMVKGGETEKFHGVTVQAILAHHSVRTPEFSSKASEAYRALLAAVGLERAEADKKQEEGIRARGSRDPKISTEGTIAYLFSFDNGFRLIYLDSSGPVTDGERQVMQKIARTDVAIVAYQGFFVGTRQIEATLPLVRLFNPRIFMPTHHDETGGSFPDMATYPLFMAIRDELPETRTISPLYRTPVCINTDTKEVFVGR